MKNRCLLLSISARYAGFIYEEVGVNPHVSVQFGGRLEHAAFTPQGDDPARDFTNVSGSFGVLTHPSESTTVAVNVARAVRNPALEELYFLGPHAGNFAFETGDPNLESEKALGLNLSLRWRGRHTSGELTYFLNNIDNFIYRQYTGAVEDDLPETIFTAGDSRLQGVESHVDVVLNSLASVEVGVDYVRGELRDSKVPLPRMPPLRGRFGLRLQKNALQAGADVIVAATQDRIMSIDGPDGPIGETPTDGYQLLKLFGSYSFQSGKALSTITLRVDNAGNTRYSNHLNYLKDLVPEIGRDVRLLYNVRF
ncbi:MAG: TonB-dependent receptor [Vicinamibacterales bacterium]